MKQVKSGRGWLTKLLMVLETNIIHIVACFPLIHYHSLQSTSISIRSTHIITSHYRLKPNVLAINNWKKHIKAQKLQNETANHIAIVQFANGV